MDRAVIFETAAVMLLILLGCALFVSISDGPRDDDGNWSTSSVNATQYMYAGSGDRLYIFDVLWDNHNWGDTNIKVLGPDGEVQWTYMVGSPWLAVNLWQRRPEAKQFSERGLPQLDPVNEMSPVFAENGNTLFLYLKYCWYDRNSTSRVGEEKIIAIRDGQLLWERPLYGDVYRLAPLEDVWMKVAGDRLFVYRSYNLSVFGTNGTPLFGIGNVSDPPSIDPEGNIYVSEVTDGPEVLLMYDANIGPQMTKIPVPSGRIASYFPNGTLRWESYVNGTPARQAMDRNAVPDGCDMPLYDGGRLYVPLEHGLVALDTEGKVLWNVSIGANVSLLSTMPFGPDGTVYMVDEDPHSYDNSNVREFYTIGPDGNVSLSIAAGPDMDLMVAFRGVGYYGHRNRNDHFTGGLESLFEVNITAVDMRSGSVSWALDIPPADARTVVTDQENIRRIFMSDSQAYASIYFTEDHPELLDRTDMIYSVAKNSWMNVLAGGNVVYVCYNLVNYEYPIGYGSGNQYTWFPMLYQPYAGMPALLNRSRINYAIGVAALDRDGNVLWNRATDTMFTSMAAGNTTFYYGTRDGGLSAVRTNVAIGFTLTAALYLFFRFFMVGAVSRARSRINDNANRNRVLKLIKAQPGNTMYEIARLLDMNAGTVRYHLLILGLNHRIATFRDGKYVRYFGNSGAYTDAEREIISLLRRDRARGLLAALLERDGMSNVELSRALDVTEPAVSGYMRELTGKGIVVRDAMPGGSVQYSIRSEYKAIVADALKSPPAAMTT